MMKSIALAAALAVISAAVLPLTAAAQEPPKKGGKPAPAARAAPAARPAAPAFHAAPAPHVSAPVQRSAPVVRSAPVHVAPVVRSAPIQHTPVVRGPVHVAPSAHIATPSHPQLSTTARSNAAGVTVQQNASQLRQERALRRVETRQLRALPANQRATRQLQIQNARQLRAQQRLNVQTATPAQTQVRSALRLNGQPRITTQAARAGRFSSAFAAQSNVGSGRFAGLAPQRAWQRGLRAGFVPWYGPVFWPYAYSDVFDYAFWPGGYDDGYWAYAYDDFFDGVFWGEAGPPEAYAYAPADGASRPSSAVARPSYAAVQELCKQPGSGVTAWPIADIEKKVGLNDEQKQLLNDVRKAGGDAAASFKASCPAENAFPLTPPGRIAAMTARLDATLQAVETMRPPLEKFYNSLSDEQKERFNQIGPKKPSNNPEAAQAATEAKSCKEQKPGLANLPIERIEDAVKPTDAQEASLKDLEDATGKAVSVLQAACPDETPITPPGRLEAMETRLKAMIEAANTVKPALETFYSSLSAEQKARFNRIGQTLAQQSSSD